MLQKGKHHIISQGVSETHMLPLSSEALNPCPASIIKFSFCLPTKPQSKQASTPLAKEEADC